MLQSNELLLAGETASAIPQDFIAYWPLDTDSLDETGDYDGTDYNMSYTSDGDGGTTATFNGTSSRIVFPTSPVMVMRTLSFWTKLDTLDHNDVPMGSSINTGAFIYWRGNAFSNLLVMVHGTFTGTTKVIDTPVNVIFVDNGANIDVYLDNVYISSLSGTMALINWNEIGARTSGVIDEWLDGQIANMYVYDYSVDADARAALVAQGI